MPIPKNQLKRLRADLAAHERRLVSLKDVIAQAVEELMVHETVLSVGHDAKVLGALGELCDQPELADEIADQPEEFFRQRGVAIPRNTRIRIVKERLGTLVVEAELRQGRFEYKLTWDKEKGFSLSPLT